MSWLSVVSIRKDLEASTGWKQLPLVFCAFVAHQFLAGVIPQAAVLIPGKGVLVTHSVWRDWLPPKTTHMGLVNMDFLEKLLPQWLLWVKEWRGDR